MDGQIKRLQAKLALQERLFNQALDLIAAEEKRDVADGKGDEPVAGVARKAAESADKGEFVLVSGAGPINRWFNDAFRKAKDNPSLLIYKLQTNAYKFSWALIPISVPFLWLLFLHRRRYRRYRAYDHTVFVTYSIAFMSLGLIALSLLRLIGAPEVVPALAIAFVPPVHIYKQLRGAYQLSRWSALWRTFVLINFAFIAASLFFTLLLALGLLG